MRVFEFFSIFTFLGAGTSAGYVLRDWPLLVPIAAGLIVLGVGGMVLGLVLGARSGRETQRKLAAACARARARHDAAD